MKWCCVDIDMIKIYSKSDSPSYIEKSCGQDDDFDVLLLEKWTNAMNNGIFRSCHMCFYGYSRLVCMSIRLVIVDYSMVSSGLAEVCPIVACYLKDFAKHP